MATVYNLFTNPSFIAGTTGWSGLALSGTSPTISTDSSKPLYGTGYSAKITFASNSPRSGLITDDNYRIAVSAGQNYTFSAYVKVPIGQATSDFSLRAYFYTSGTAGAGSLSSSDSVPTTISSYDGWVRLTFTFVVPATATHFRGFIYRSLTTTAVEGYNFLVDAVQFQTGTEATPLIYDQGQKNKLVDTSLTNVYIDHLTGMKLKADIRLGDFVFNRIDEYGVVWVVDNVDGWWNLPEVNVQDLPRGWGDGSYTTFGRFGARTLTITGSFLLQDTDTQLEASRERLINAINLVKKDAWLVLDEETPKALKVRISGTPEISTTNPRGRTNFSIGLVAANPIKFKWEDARDDGYALETITNNSSKVIRNDGNTPVPVIFEIIGPTTGPTSLFNKKSEQLIDVIYRLDKYKTYAVSTAKVLNGNLVFTTNASHGFSVGDPVDLLNIVDVFDISSVVCSTNNYLDISTTLKHNFSVGQRIYLTGISGLTNYSSVTNDEYEITGTYSSDDYKFRISVSGLSTAASQSGVASSNFSVSANTYSIVFDGPNNVATVTTQAAHGFSTQDQVVLSNVGAVYSGTYTITSVPSTTSFEVPLYNSQTITSVTDYESTLSLGTITIGSTLSAQADDYITIDGVNESFNGTHKVVSANSTAITFYKKFGSTTNATSISSNPGTVYLSDLSSRSSASFTSGKAYYGNIYNGSFTVSSVSSSTPDEFTINRPIYYSNVGVSSIGTYDGNTSPTVRTYAETLSIDTYTRDIAINGEIGGYRSKLDTVVDWIELQPGDNEIAFEDLNKISVTQVAFTTSGNVATITLESNHNFVAGSQVKLIGLNTVSGGSNVFANASTATIATIPDTKTFTFTPTNYSGASNISPTTVSTGYIYEVSKAYVNVYYRSGWIG
jgi:hypothetical protein